MSSTFAPLCPEQPLALSQGQQENLDFLNSPRNCETCGVNFQWGFFFDGTNNNLIRDTPHLSQSNIARLYDVYEVDPERPEIQRRYTAGVGRHLAMKSVTMARVSSKERAWGPAGGGRPVFAGLC